MKAHRPIRFPSLSAVAGKRLLPRRLIRTEIAPDEANTNRLSVPRVVAVKRSDAVDDCSGQRWVETSASRVGPVNAPDFFFEIEEAQRDALEVVAVDPKTVEITNAAEDRMSIGGAGEREPFRASGKSIAQLAVLDAPTPVKEIEVMRGRHGDVTYSHDG